MSIQEVGLAGYYTVEKLNEKDEVVWSTSFKNLITDIGFNAFLTRDINLSTLAVFADTAIPNTGIATIGVSTYYTTTTIEQSSKGVNTDSQPYFFQKQTYVFNKGAISGNINRVAVLFSNSTVFSISSIKDHLGNDTTIQLHPNERLRVTYEFRVYQPKEESVIFPNVNLGDDGVTDITVRTALTSESWITNLLFKPKGIYGATGNTYSSRGSVLWNDKDVLPARSTPVNDNTAAIGRLSLENATATYGKYKEKDCMEFKLIIPFTELPDKSLKTIYFHTGMGGFQIGYGKLLTRAVNVKKMITIKLYIAVARV